LLPQQSRALFVERLLIALARLKDGIPLFEPLRLLVSKRISPQQQVLDAADFVLMLLKMLMVFAQANRHLHALVAIK
jgi:hypothetical protein